MWTKSLKPKADTFQKQELKLLRGQIPKHISGRMFRNGPGVLARSDEVESHWFMGTGAVLHVEFASGRCWAQYQHIPTPRYLEEEKTNKRYQRGVLSYITNFITGNLDPNFGNPTNTSILPIPNSNTYLALCEGGSPYKISKDQMKFEGYQNYGFITSCFSAHPKVDPDNGDIYNFGMKKTNINVYRISKDMKLLAQTQIKLRELQSIHDCVLAGDYLVLMEYPISFSLAKLMYSRRFFDSIEYNTSYDTIIHILDKHTLKEVEVLRFDPFYSFHYSNGYCVNGKELHIEFVGYNSQDVPEFFRFLRDFPKILEKGVNITRETFTNSFLGEFVIDLEKKTVKLNKDTELGKIQFPVVSDSVVGKEWEFTYASQKTSKDPNGYFNTIVKYSRKTHQKVSKDFGDNSMVSEPLLIESAEGCYVICVVYHSENNQSLIYLLKDQDLSEVCAIELPSVIPPGFHGKWDTDPVTIQ